MKKTPWRSALYAAMLLYLFMDLKVCHGPLRTAMMSRRDAAVEAAVKNGWVVLINLEPVTREQLDLAVARHLYQRGKTPEEIPEKNLGMIRRAVLQTVIDETLIRQYADGEKFNAPTEETDAFIAAWRSQFDSPDELAKRAEMQGLDEEAINGELARIWSRKRWLEERISPAVIVTEEETKAWFDTNRISPEGELRAGFFEPEKVRARQIFLSTVEADGPDRETLIREIHEQLIAGTSSFEALARKHSEDLRTREKGGDLNWFSRDHLPGDFTSPVFKLKVGEPGEPFQTRLGWHIVEVTDRQEKRPLAYDEIANEIRAHLESERTEETVKLLIEKRRKVANIQLFPENI